MCMADVWGEKQSVWVHKVHLIKGVLRQWWVVLSSVIAIADPSPGPSLNILPPWIKIIKCIHIKEKG